MKKLFKIPFRQCGIELTYVPEDVNFGLRDWRDLAPYKNEINKLIGKNRYGSLLNTAHIDPSVIEIPTKILRTWKEAEKAYLMAEEVTSEVNFTSFNEKFAGGGGHIHLGGMTDVEMEFILNSVEQRPWLACVALSSGDTINALPNIVKIGTFNSMTARLQSISMFHAVVFRFYEDDNRDFKNHATLEHRAFDMAADWEIQALHLALVQQHANWAINNKIQQCDVERQKQLEKGLSLDDCIKEFKNFIKNLHLDWDDYKWMIDRNLVPRLDKIKKVKAKIERAKIPTTLRSN